MPMENKNLRSPSPLRPNLRSDFLIAADLTFLNHGSFGATPRVVFDEHTRWRERIEADPIELLARRGSELIETAKHAIGNWLGMNPRDFGLVTNATEAINSVLRSLRFSPGDELLTTSHVYNAVRQAMKYVADRTGADYREVEIPVPVESPRVVEQAILDALTPRTRLLVIDHVTSPTALVFPIEKILAGCADRGVDVLVDGAHAPGMLELNVTALAPAYYAGNLHKWACAPKGSAFLWCRPDRQSHIHPLVISHHFGQGMSKEFDWQGTRDFAAWFSVPRAIDYMAAIGWEKIISHNHAMAVWTNQLLCSRWNVPSLSPIGGSMLGSMATTPLPPPLDRLSDEQIQTLQRRLHDRERIEVPVLRWAGRTCIRPCCQIYNVAEDFHRLADAIATIAGNDGADGFVSKPPGLSA
jgi:isopenicillin-N epimerase